MGLNKLFHRRPRKKMKLMYDFVTKFGKQLRDDYKSIPKKDRKRLTYEQFIVAQFSNLIDEQL